MKRFCILYLFVCVVILPLAAQNVGYTSLKALMQQVGDTLPALKIEHRTKNQILLVGGADYRITVAGDDAMGRWLRKRCLAVSTSEGKLYLNCRKLRYKKLCFGMWYAPALRLGTQIYFSAMPLGSMIGENFVEENDVKLGGNVGDALASSGLVHKRVCYVLDGITGKVDFVDKNKMLQLLEGHPAWKEEYLKQNSQEAACAFKFLRRLQSLSKD